MGVLKTTLKEKLVDALREASVKVYGYSVDTLYIEQWFKAIGDKCLDTLLQCSAEDIVKDIYKTFVVKDVQDKILKAVDVFKGKEDKLYEALLKSQARLVFKVYYGYNGSLTELIGLLTISIKLYDGEKIRFINLYSKLKDMKPNDYIRFTITDPNKKEVKRIYTAFMVVIGDKTFYGIESITDRDYAPLACGIENVSVSMLTELVRAYGETFEEYFDRNMHANPILYVLK